ncbi:hypothetical protein [Cryobacterium sp. MDB2-33-2]|uniref:hypothetical protein n=1 Tax=Cryobacterium sp. MDB2-33-2 TaxID=1259179 RepID=UPI0010699EDC|nr:hypothetical protein [Cryobacterium sp. MDB2-33-2]TFC08147.1 hypothetical protein E3O59_08515 [Cryobacterium sp. MDB2-33-2]
MSRRSGISGSRPRALSRALAVSLALVGVLVSLLALHSMLDAHDGVQGAVAGVTQFSAQNGETPAVADNVLATSEDRVGPLSALNTCGTDCAVGCALMAAGCIVLITVVAIVLLLRRPALFQTLKDGGGGLVRVVAEIRNHVYFPSLTLLSISRI